MKTNGYALLPGHRLRRLFATMALIVLLTGCVPTKGINPTPTAPAGGGPLGATPAPTVTAVAAMAPAASALAATTLPQATVAATTLPQATMAATVAAPGVATGVVAVAATGVPTAAATPPAGSIAIAVQSQDNAIQLVDAAGRQRLLYKAGAPVDLSSIFWPGNVVDSFLYLPLSGNPGGAVRVGPAGTDVLSWIQGPVYGLAADASTIAWGTADLNKSPVVARIMTSGPDGAHATAVVTQTATTIVPQVLRVMRWSADGRRLYYGREPTGLGGYILFSGLTNLWAYDTATGKTSELIHERAANAAVCIDDLSPDEALAADHCSGNAMTVLDVKTGQASTIAPPSDVPPFGTLGGARWSPDGAALAYGLARHDPNNEQGWIALADVAGGGARPSSRLIATSPTNDYFSVAGWLDASTIVLQSSGAKAGVWTVTSDGANLKRLADGVFLGMLPLAGFEANAGPTLAMPGTGTAAIGTPAAGTPAATPAATGQSCGKFSLLGPNPSAPLSAKAAEDCFWQAFQAGNAATLIVTIASVDAGIIHTFSVVPGAGKPEVQDSAAHYVLPNPATEPTVNTCSGLVRQDGGLLFQGCGDQGDILVPAPPNA